MVYLKSPDQKRSVAIHIPLMSENLTYVYAPRIEETPFEAQIFDAESPTNKALPKVTLQVAGQDTQKTISDELGRANLKSLSYVNGYSTWIDLQMPSGDHPVNRFEVDQRGKQNEFYYFKAPLFKNWTRQLEGGVSSAGGYFVAALGGVSTEPVWAQTTSLIDATHSSAETYSIDRGGFLRVGTPLDEESLRAFGSELQDDLYRLEVLDESRTTLWSKLLFTSPGVLNVIRAH